jgi:transposase
VRAQLGVELISRDRAGVYADGARDGASEAVQIADRWHLLKNLTKAVERFIDRHHSIARQAAKIVPETQVMGRSLTEASTAILSSRDEGDKRARCEKRDTRYLEGMHRRWVSLRLE